MSFGGDRHHKLETSSNANTYTTEMDKILMGKFKPAEEHWNDDRAQSGYHTKAFRLVLNRCNLNLQEGTDSHLDKSSTYAPTNPIALAFVRMRLLADYHADEQTHECLFSPLLPVPRRCQYHVRTLQ